MQLFPIELQHSTISDDEYYSIEQSKCNDPFKILGIHEIGDNFVIRHYNPKANSVSIQFDNSYCFLMTRKTREHLFEVMFATDDANSVRNIRYDLVIVQHGIESKMKDTYNFGLVSDFNKLSLFKQGIDLTAYHSLGVHKRIIDNIEGYSFAVWAPNALAVSLVGDFNDWDSRTHAMRFLCDFGVWEIFIPFFIPLNSRYMFHIMTRDGVGQLKIDPFCRKFESPPQHRCIISDQIDHSTERFNRQHYCWNDQEWINEAGYRNKFRNPMLIYEVHLNSWRRKPDNTPYSYAEIAPMLVDHCKKFNFNYVEFLPLTHYPYEGSWGYQVTGFHAVYSALGSAYELKYLIDLLHQNKIGVILDIVLAHFASDDWALLKYDGTALYEPEDERLGKLENWGTYAFNFGRNEVRSFLFSSMHYWVNDFHLDGLRFDAVSCMVYRSYDRPRWTPNEYGTNLNLEAISFIKGCNSTVHELFPNVYLIAEESTEFEGVTKPDGLNFDLKWDLGWMHDTLDYTCTPAMNRAMNHNKLTFRSCYIQNERWILPYSHDEVVNGSGSLVDKAGFIDTPFYEKLMCLKCLLAFQVASPGRVLLFMGAEFAQRNEWRVNQQLSWDLLSQKDHHDFSLYVEDLYKVYMQNQQLWKGDDQPWNFQWTECDNANSCMIAFLRKWSKDPDVFIVINFSNQLHGKYEFGIINDGTYKVLLNSDDWKYGGQMIGYGAGTLIKANLTKKIGYTYALTLDVPPYGVLILVNTTNN